MRVKEVVTLSILGLADACLRPAIVFTLFGIDIDVCNAASPSALTQHKNIIDF